MFFLLANEATFGGACDPLLGFSDTGEVFMLIKMGRRGSK